MLNALKSPLNRFIPSVWGDEQILSLFTLLTFLPAISDRSRWPCYQVFLERLCLCVAYRVQLLPANKGSNYKIVGMITGRPVQLFVTSVVDLFMFFRSSKVLLQKWPVCKYWGRVRALPVVVSVCSNVCERKKIIFSVLISLSLLLWLVALFYSQSQTAI